MVLCKDLSNHLVFSFIVSLCFPSNTKCTIIVTTPQNVAVLRGNNVTLSCIYTTTIRHWRHYISWRIYEGAKQKEIAQYRCTKPNVCVKHTVCYNYSIEADGDLSGNLTILNYSSPNARALYRCAVDNGLESSGSDVEVLAVDPPDKIILESLDPNQIVSTGGNITCVHGSFLNLSCTSIFSSDYPVDVTWNIEEKGFRNSNVSQNFTNGRYVSTGWIQMEVLQTFHGKELTCGHDIMGIQFQRSVLLNVHFRPIDVLINNRSGNSSIQAIVGVSYLLTCAVLEARPPPLIQWHVTSCSDHAVWTVENQLDEAQINMYRSLRKLHIQLTKGEQNVRIQCDVTHSDLIDTLRASVYLKVQDETQKFDTLDETTDFDYSDKIQTKSPTLSNTTTYAAVAVASAIFVTLLTRWIYLEYRRYQRAKENNQIRKDSPRECSSNQLSTHLNNINEDGFGYTCPIELPEIPDRPLAFQPLPATSQEGEARFHHPLDSCNRARSGTFCESGLSKTELNINDDATKLPTLDVSRDSLIHNYQGFDEDNEEHIYIDVDNNDQSPIHKGSHDDNEKAMSATQNRHQTESSVPDFTCPITDNLEYLDDYGYEIPNFTFA